MEKLNGMRAREGSYPLWTLFKNAFVAVSTGNLTLTICVFGIFLLFPAT
jgi:hypothetical protein